MPYRSTDTPGGENTAAKAPHQIRERSTRARKKHDCSLVGDTKRCGRNSASSKIKTRDDRCPPVARRRRAVVAIAAQPTSRREKKARIYQNSRFVHTPPPGSSICKCCRRRCRAPPRCRSSACGGSLFSTGTWPSEGPRPRTLDGQIQTVEKHSVDSSVKTGDEYQVRHHSATYMYKYVVPRASQRS